MRISGSNRYHGSTTALSLVMQMANSIIAKLRDEATDAKVSLSGVLMRAQIAARKLALPTVPEWLSKEIDGYENVDDLPPYRWIDARSAVLNPNNGKWFVIDLSAKTPLAPILFSISQIEYLVEKRSSEIVSIAQKPLLIGNDFVESYFSHRAEVRMESIWKITDDVRKIVVKWILELDTMGIEGKNGEFTLEEASRAIVVNQSFVAATLNLGAGAVSGAHNTLSVADSGNIKS